MTHRIGRVLRGALLATVPLMAVAAQPASSATILLNDIGGVTGTQAEFGFRAAARYWESILSDNVTLRFNVGFSDLGAGILGGASSAFYSTTVSNFYLALNLDRTSQLDQTAFANLQPLVGGGLTMVMPGYVDPVTGLGADATTGRVDSDGSLNNTRLLATGANIRALGFTLGAATDATIRFNSTVAFDFNPTDGISAGSSDFIGVAIHEIGHALGFTSGVDDLDFVSCPSGSGCADFRDERIDNFSIGHVLDLYRYSAPDTLNWRPGTEAYFSIDGGDTEFLGNANFSTGEENGDGWQASHWKAPTNSQGQNICTGLIGIMNPYLCGGRVATVTAQDLGALDAIGWNLNVNVLGNPDYRYSSAQAYQAAVPEPTTWALMIAGFGAVGAALRRRRTTVAVTVTA